ncbi:Coiled-coil alpha-helical rod protein 1 [Holothuria leucospilota]|uniref:Coiled-coil alpha-helical rod protein 1 n=1 Tax=Holothuria leucospilota TaxID=206669 RepID=A0A9Q1C5C5_HOLLE|nr:Coiled-coil alpha-helical rod protein 1 [Holothuria leucospilota]
MMAASLKAPSDFAKPFEGKNLKGNLLTPDSLLLPRVKTQKEKITKAITIPSGTQTESRWMPEEPYPTTTQRSKSKLLSVHRQPDIIVSPSATAVPSEIRAKVDVHQYQPHPVTHVPPTPVYQPPPQPPSQEDLSMVHLKHTAEVISRQAADIANLKTEAEQMTSKHYQEKAKLQRQLEETENRCKEDVSRLQNEITHLKELHSEQVSHDKKLHVTEMTVLKDELGATQKQLKETETLLQQKVNDLEGRLRAAEEENTSAVVRYEKDLREKNEALQKSNAQLMQMKVYIQDCRPSVKTVTEWEVEKKEMEKKIKDLQNVIDSMKETEQYTNIRLSSTQQILVLQEAEVLKSQKESSPDLAASILLTKWREKVYAMLVQQKSQELIADKENREWESKVRKLEEKLQMADTTIQRLEHTLSDKEAELNLEKQMSLARHSELQSTEEIAASLDNHLTAWEESGKDIKRMLTSNQEFFSERMTTIHKALNKLTAAEQRINFAASRVDLLKDLFARKESSWRLAMSKVTGTTAVCQSRDTTTQTDSVQNEDSLPWEEMKSELQNVRKERDLLASELRELSEKTEQRVKDAMQSLEEQLREQRNKNSVLEGELQQGSKDLNALREEIRHREQELQDLTETNASLKVTLAKVQSKADTASDERCAALEDKHQMEIKEMEKRLNEARREHAKAVVSYRQMERQLARDKERANESLQGRETYLNQEIERLKVKLKEAEKEKNLLMTTLKQEGLISKYKSYRRAAKNLNEEMQEEDAFDEDQENRPPVGDQETTKIQRKVKMRKNHKEDASLSVMLQEVQSLAAKVLREELAEDAT